MAVTLKKLAVLAHKSLVSEGHGATYEKCKCYGHKELHLAIEEVLPPRLLSHTEQETT